jgi:putative redox protein
MLLGRYLEQINKIEIETEGFRREGMPTSFTKISVTFDVEGNIEGERVWKSIRLGHKKYCAVSDSLKANFDYQLILNGVPILEPS